MALKLNVSHVLVFLLILFTLVGAIRPIPRRSRARAFIELQCQATRYSDLCVRYLSHYANNFTTIPSHQQLAQFALRVSLAKAESTQAYIVGVAKELKQRKATGYSEVNRCLEQINDGVEQLTNCIKETQQIKENGESTNFPWHASNVQTWMSTAWTDASTCLDEFYGRTVAGKTKATIKVMVLNLQHTTSIALALFNRFAARYRSSHVNMP